MASFNPADSGYVEVKDRIVEFYTKYPEGSIRTNIFEYSDTRVVVGAEAFRHRDDEHPVGTGFSSLEIPGKTPYTLGSELENAETSAVGRAIAMAGFEVKKSIASKEEIESKARPAPAAPDPLDKKRKNVRALAEHLWAADWKKELKTFGLTVTKADSEKSLNGAWEAMKLLNPAAAEAIEDEIPF